MDAMRMEEIRRSYGGREVYIVSTDKERLTMLGEDGSVYRQRPDRTWSADAADAEGAVRWQGSAFHGFGIRLKPLYVMQGGSWINVFTGRQEATKWVEPRNSI